MRGQGSSGWRFVLLLRTALEGLEDPALRVSVYKTITIATRGLCTRIIWISFLHVIVSQYDVSVCVPFSF